VTFIGWDGTRADAEQIVDLEAATKADDAEEDRDDYRGAWKDYNRRG